MNPETEQTTASGTPETTATGTPKKKTKSKAETLAATFTPEMQKSLRDVNLAAERYKTDRSDGAYTALLAAVLTAAAGGALMFAPVSGLSGDQKGVELSSFRAGPVEGLVLCTTPEEAARCPEEMMILVRASAVVSAALRDREYRGIYLNPYGPVPCLLRKEHMATLLRLMQPDTPATDSEGGLQ